MTRVVLTDIEGTTTDISFVYDVLFPYARQHLAAYLREHIDDPLLVEPLEQIRGMEPSVGNDPDAITALLLGWMDDDLKLAPLKTIQGLVWMDGYETGSLQGHVYDDVPPRLREFRDQGLQLAIYSSGSVRAQQLLFGNSNHGDLTPLFKTYFDTAVGGKKESRSYQRIARELVQPPGSILFLSDIAEELDAAAEAGLETLQLIRDGRTVPAKNHRQVADFTQITINTRSENSA